MTKKRNIQKKQKQKSLSKSNYIPPETWNAYRIIKKSVELNGIEMTGSPRNMPITIKIPPELLPPDKHDEIETVLATHFDVAQYGMGLVNDMGYDASFAVDLCFDGKATKAFVKNMYLKD